MDGMSFFVDILSQLEYLEIHNLRSYHSDFWNKQAPSSRCHGDGEKEPGAAGLSGPTVCGDLKNG